MGNNTCSTKVENEELHPVQTTIGGKPESVFFIPFSELAGLQSPYPRRQDINAAPMAAKSQDMVVCISHAWPYQTHPDPTGEKAQCINDMFREVNQVFPDMDPLVFLDFVSVTQRPRTALDNELFQAALRAMPMIYLRADAVVHIDKDFEPVVEGQTVTVKADFLRRSKVGIRAVGDVIQLAGTPGGQDTVQENDVIVSVNGYEIPPSLENATGRLQEGSNVVIRKAPYGVRNEVPAGTRGWIFLERFCSMVKVAMLNDDNKANVVFSNNPAVLQEIFAGGAKLREAAQKGSVELHEALTEFGAELRRKSFSTTSTCLIEKRETAGRNSTAEAFDEDAQQVFEIMDTCVAFLREHWAEEKRKQTQRELTQQLNSMSNKEHLTSAMQGVKQSANAVELTYFPLIGRGEYIFLICLEHDIPLKMQEFKGEFGPTGTIPTLKHGEVELWDSTAIVQYLIQRFPGPSTPPAHLAIKALDFWAILQDYYSFVLSPMHDIIMGLPRRNLRLTDACRVCGAQTLGNMEGKPIMSGKLIDLHILRTTYLEQVLVKRGSPEYICGVFTYVDLMLYTFVTSIDKCKGFQIFRDTFKMVTKKDDCWEHCPSIRAICNRVAQRPKVAPRESRYAPCDI